MTDSNPMVKFREWYLKAQECGLTEPTSVALATVDSQNRPACRIVLLKDYSEAGFTFFTNQKSQKGQHLQENPQAALCFHWMPLCRQVRARGGVIPISPSQADGYWKTRSRDSQIGAWASTQSESLESREILLEVFASFQEQYDGTEIPRPPHWSGYQLKPEILEFWEQGDHRLHHREEFSLHGQSWVSRLLFP
jgi:pyridoxamine 5'-phosphate oxidase